MPPSSTGVGWIRWALLLAAALDLIALKAGWWSHNPMLLMALVSATLLGFLIHLAALGRSLIAGVQRGRTAAAILGSIGIVVALAGGSANWLLGLQGYVILTEGEKVRLESGKRLQEFDAGPLARVDEMNVTLGLEELELVAATGDRFYPASSIRVWRQGKDSGPLEISPHKPAVFGQLRIHQGAFGFAPRIVILHGEDPSREVFDQVVPFLTQRQGPAGISFVGSFNIAAEDLKINGAVDLTSLDEEMRGHSILDLVVAKEGRALGAGKLLPGKFAEIEEGYRVGFAGLEQWSEIVVSRKDYSSFVFGGAVLAVLGGILWLLAVWRGG